MKVQLTKIDGPIQLANQVNVLQIAHIIPKILREVTNQWIST